MKQVLIIDESPLFREYLRDKLTEHGVEVTVAVNALDGISKMRNVGPDLMIMDYHLSRQGYLEVLRQKKDNPNAVRIPVIVLARHIDQKRILELIPYQVKKVFTKPVKIDALFATLRELLSMPFSTDESPGIVEVHVNDDIIFVEIARGLNRDKLDLLRFKIAELVEWYGIRVPKVILMLSDITLGFADGPNLQKLLETVLSSSKVTPRHIRVLTRDAFVRQFIEGQKEYAGIEVVSNLQYAMDGLLRELDGSMTYGEKKAEIIGDRVLSAGDSAADGTVTLRFDADTRPKALDAEALREVMRNLRVAVVDDDGSVQELVTHTFLKAGAGVRVFSDGGEYLSAAGKEPFDLVFLDLMMSKVDGFAVLGALYGKGLKQPVVVLSEVNQRDMVIRAFRMGARSYLTKPLTPDALFRKAMEVLKPDF